MTGISNFDVNHLIPYDDTQRCIMRLSSEQIFSFYKVSFVEEHQGHSTVVDVRVSVDGRIVEFERCMRVRNHRVRVLGEPHETKFRYMFVGLSFRLWFPQFNFKRYIYRYRRCVSETNIRPRNSLDGYRYCAYRYCSRLMEKR